MLSKKDRYKMEEKLLKNKLNGRKPSNKTELAKHLGFSRQLLTMICNSDKSNVAEQKVIIWINEK